MLEEEFKRYIAEKKLIPPHGKVLLGVSGGADSMVMLELFARTGIEIGVAHCNFGLRGDESDGDELLVRRRAEELDAEFFSVRFDTREEMERTGESLQMAARRLRYDWFERLCAAFGYDRIAIAHNADDTVETFFINLIRGTGLKGLTGIPRSRRNIIRPLLFAPRTAVEAYAAEHRVPYRNDSTNAETKYLRNRIRHGIVPRLHEISPRFTETMLENIDRLSQVQGFVEERLEGIGREIVRPTGGETEIDIERWKGHPSFRYVLYETLRPWGFHAETAADLCECAEKGYVGRRFLSDRHTALLDRGKVVVSPRQTVSGTEAVSLPSPKSSVDFRGLRFRAEVLFPYEVESYRTPDHIALFDLEQVDFPLTVRTWAPGDRFQPLGMEGRKKVSDLLVDAKVPRTDKERQAVVCNGGGEIVWVVGRRIDDRFKITLLTNRILRLTVEKTDLRTADE